MAVTMADILALRDLGECKLLNPKVSCVRVVKAVTIMDNPDILNWMSENEILFSNGSFLTSYTTSDWEAFFKGLAKKKASGLFIKLNYHIKDIPKPIIDYATRIDMPIVVVPNDYPWEKLATPIQQYISEREYYLVNEALDLNDVLRMSMQENGPIEDVCKAAAIAMSCEIAVYNMDTGRIEASSNDDLWVEVIRSRRLSNCSRAQAFQSFEACDGYIVSYRLRSSGEKCFAMYYAESKEDAERKFGQHKINQVNSALLLCLGREEALRKIEEHYYVDFLGDLIDGRLNEHQEIGEKASRLRRKIYDAYQIAVSTSLEGRIYDFSNLVRDFKKSFNPMVRDVMYYVRSGSIVLFCPALHEEDRKVVEEACDIVLDHIKGNSIKFGVSRINGIENSSNGYSEALTASSLSALVSDKVVYYDDIGLLCLLARNANELDTAFISNFYEEVMVPIKRHDADGKVGLLETLETYFANKCSIRRTASALYIHENTLRMRLKTIESLSGCDLGEPQGIAKLYLALTIEQCREATRGTLSQ